MRAFDRRVFDCLVSDFRFVSDGVRRFEVLRLDDLGSETVIASCVTVESLDAVVCLLLGAK